MTLRILADENIPALAHYLGHFGPVSAVSGRAIEPAQLAGVDVLLVRSVTRVDAALLDGSSVKFVGTATSGLDHIDRDYLSRRGVGFAYASGSNANSVVEYVLSAISAVGDTLERLLEGGTVGIVGYGVIGRAMAARLQALGVDHCACDPWLQQGSIPRPAPLEQVLACGVVTLHAELTREQPWPSFHLLGEKELAAMPSDTLLVNASRGAVVDNRALLRLRENGLGPIPVLDVWEGEPAIDHALLKRVILGTSHIAGYSLDGKLLATRMLGEAVAAHFALQAHPPPSPAGAPGTIDVGRTLSGAGLLRELLRSRYDIQRDDARLRSVTLGKPAKEAAAGFDLLRRDYPQRRELSGSTVRGNCKHLRDRELVRGLGCEILGAEPGAADTGVGTG